MKLPKFMAPPILSSVLFCGTSFADDPFRALRAGHLSEMCKSTGNDWFECAGYLSAMVESSALASDLDGVELRFCVPWGVGVTTGQLIQIFVRWSENNPHHLHKARAWAVGQAFREAFPCS